MNRPLLRRRALFALFTGAAIATPLAARAQQPRPRRVGYLNLRAKGSFGHLGDYLRALQDTGFVEGRNLAIEYRYANGDYARMPVLAAELVRDNVEVISAFGSPASARAAMRATSTIPIVGLSVAPLVKHYNRPEGNVTGVRIITGDLTPKRLQILAEIVPGAAIGVLMNPTYPFHARDRKAIEDAARVLGIRVVFANASAGADFAPAFAALARQRVGAMLPEAEPYLASKWPLLVGLSARHKIPMLQEWGDAVAAGGLISYAPSLAWITYQVGHYTGRILNGAKPADLPVIAPTQIELAINLKTAKALGLQIPPLLLAQADKVIQ